jgi:NTE family protein
MIRALLETGVRPDLVIGTSVGALNGAMLSMDPTAEVVERLVGLWRSAGESELYADNPVRQVRRAIRTGTHLYSSRPLRERLESELGETTFEELAVPFQCCAASIERAGEHWFTTGRVVDAVLASAAVPGLFGPQRIGEEHFLDGGIVNSIPVGRAVDQGASLVFVLQVGRVDRPLTVPRRPWEVARVSFEIARRHRFHREMNEVPTDVEVHVLPTGGGSARDDALLAYRDFSRVEQRLEAAYDASRTYLQERL